MITERHAMAALGTLAAAGLKPPDAHSLPADPNAGTPPGRVLAARVYAAALNHAGLTPAELEAAVVEYIAEPDAGQYPKAFPSPGHLVARSPMGRALAALGSDSEGEAAWAHMLRRMAHLGYQPDRDRPDRHLHHDPTKNDALFTALARFGGAERWREMPTQDANPAGYGAAKKAWIACFMAARREQGNNPTTVRQMVAASHRQIEASK